jgi:hypothetical protein
MHPVKKFLYRVPLIRNGNALAGIAFVLAGVLTVRLGAIVLWDYWLAASQHMPFSMPQEAAKWIANSLPLIFGVFVNVVSAACAVLIGSLWILLGIWEAFQGRKKSADLPALDQPELTAQSLCSGEPVYWESPPLIARLLHVVWPRSRGMTPISYDSIADLLESVVKVCVIGLAVWLLFFALNTIPALAHKHAGVNISLTVPPAGPLYWLLVFVAAADIAILVSLLPLRSRHFHTSKSVMPVHGRGEPHVFFALVEEGCRLLTAKGAPENRPVRLEASHAADITGTLVESSPVRVASFGRPAAYICLPLAVFLLIAGFSRLVHYDPGLPPMLYTEFFSAHFLGELVRLAFAFGLIIVGLHFSEVARELLAVRMFRSSLVFLYCDAPAGMRRATKTGPGHETALMSPDQYSWKIAGGVDDQLAEWARQPQAVNDFRITVRWAETVSEASERGGRRYVVRMERSQSLETAVGLILELPFYVHLNRGDMSSTGPQPSASQTLRPDDRAEAGTPAAPQSPGSQPPQARTRPPAREASVKHTTAPSRPTPSDFEPDEE